MNFPNFKKYTNMEENESITSTNTNPEQKIESENNTDEIVDFVEQKTKSIAYKGVLLGLNEALKSLNMFLDEKVAMGKIDTMSRHELNLFMQTYISEYEKGIKEYE